MITKMSKKAVLAVTFLLCVGVAASSLRFSSTVSPPDTAVASNALAYEAYSIGINTVLYDANGQINYTLRADRQTQFVDDTTELENPYIRLYQNAAPTWNVAADTGTIRQPTSPEQENSRSILLNGNVEVYSVNEYGNRTTMTTNSLDVNFDKEQLSTQESVLVETDVLTQTSMGMFADLIKDETVFHQDIQGTYEYENPN